MLKITLGGKGSPTLPEEKLCRQFIRRYDELSANTMDKLRSRRAIHKSLTSHAEYSEGSSSDIDVCIY
jgi:hypothetical protein